MNPVPGGSNSCEMIRAERYVRTERAQWVTPTSIKFTENDPRHKAAIESAQRTGWGYDKVGGMTREQIRHIPVLFPERLR